MREALGSPHVDSRPSRGPAREALVRLAQPEISARVRDIDDADAILVLGTDPLHSSPILDLRIRKAIRRNGARLAVATERPTALDGGAAARRPLRARRRRRLPRRAGERPAGRRAEAATAAEVAEVLRGAESVVVLWGERIAREGAGAIGALLDLADALDMAARTARACSKSPTSPTPAACARSAASPTPAPASPRPRRE